MIGFFTKIIFFKEKAPIYWIFWEDEGEVSDGSIDRHSVKVSDKMERRHNMINIFPEINLQTTMSIFVRYRFP